MPEPRACDDLELTSDRLNSLEEWKANANLTVFGLCEQVQILTRQVRRLEESQKQEATDHYAELRRIIKVIGLAEIIGQTQMTDLDHAGDMMLACTALYRRYGHLQFDGKPLWSKPPTVSDQTKTLIAEALRRRQEA
jgi:hypothetical protein